MKNREKEREILKQGSKVSKHKVATSIVVKGANVSIYFDANSMDYLTGIKYKYPKKARGALLNFIVREFQEKYGDKIPDSILVQI